MQDHTPTPSPLPTLLHALADRLEAIRGLPAASEVRRDDLLVALRSVAERLAVDEDALVVVCMGSTGSGTSSLVNAVAGRVVSPVGVRRPTTSQPVVWAHRTRADRYRSDGVAGVGGMRVVADSAPLLTGLTLIDAPDPDSIAADHAVAAHALLRVADVVVLVTTPARYGDGVPWAILRSLAGVGVPLIPVMNRIRDDATGRLQVGHLVQRARAEGLVLDLDEVLRFPEGSEGLPVPLAAPLAELLAAVADEDAEATVAAARVGAVAAVLSDVRRLVDEAEDLAATRDRGARQASAAAGAERATVLAELRSSPPGATSQGPVILRLAGRHDDDALAACEPRLVAAAAADLARRHRGDPGVLTAVVRRAATDAGVLDAAPRAALLLSLGAGVPGVPRAAAEVVDRFLSTLAELVAPPPASATIELPPDLGRVLAATEAAAP